MINPEELMLGNWVYTILNVPVQVPAVIGTDPNWNPIPLTPEILERAGFKYHEKDNVWLFETIAIQLDSVYWWSSCWQYIDEQFETVAVWREIGYLHQLQNLYFALTGEILQIDLQS